MRTQQAGMLIQLHLNSLSQRPSLTVCVCVVLPLLSCVLFNLSLSSLRAAVSTLYAVPQPNSPCAVPLSCCLLQPVYVLLAESNYLLY